MFHEIDKAPSVSLDQWLIVFRETVVEMVKRDTPDLSARQQAVFLSVYLDEHTHTVRGLAKMLNVSKPAITRALDRLAYLDLIKRAVDPMDRRSILIQRTLNGAAYLQEFHSIIKHLSRAKSELLKATSLNFTLKSVAI